MPSNSREKKVARRLAIKNQVKTKGNLKKDAKRNVGSSSAKLAKQQKTSVRIRRKALPRGRKVSMVFVLVLAVLALSFTYVLISSGFVPGISNLVGASSPRDLGVDYTGADKANARLKSQLQYGTLPASTPIEQSIQRRGSHDISADFSSAELTALLNGRPYKYWPIENAQLRINTDDSVEMSGRLLSNKFESYVLSEGVPAVLAQNVSKLIVNDPAFYIKGRLMIRDNKLVQLSVSRLEIGKLRIPIFVAKRWNSNSTAKVQFAETETDRSTLGLVNEMLGKNEGLNIREAGFSNERFYFEGSLSAIELTVR